MIMTLISYYNVPSSLQQRSRSTAAATDGSISASSISAGLLWAASAAAAVRWIPATGTILSTTAVPKRQLSKRTVPKSKSEKRGGKRVTNRLNIYYCQPSISLSASYVMLTFFLFSLLRIDGHWSRLGWRLTRRSHLRRFVSSRIPRYSSC